MRWKLPFFGHVLLWFVVNLAVLAAVLLVLLRLTGRPGLDSFLAGQATPRVASLAAAVAGELRAAPSADWASVLERFGSAYGVRLFLARADGRAFDNQSPAWPPEVAGRLAGPWPPPGAGRPPPPGPGLDRGPGPVAGPLGPPPVTPGDGPPESPDGRRPGLPEDGGILPSRGLPRPGEIGRRPPLPQMVFLQKARGDQSYWAAVRIQMPPRDREVRLQPQPAFLLIRSATLSAGGLFFDPQPWVWSVVAALVLSALVWWPFVRGVTSRLRLVDQAAGRIARGDFDPILGTSHVQEIASLADSVNRMSSRLRDFVGGQKRFLGDIAHELCSPLARMEVALGILEQRVSDAGRESLEDVREDVREMSALVNELLSFSKASIAGNQVMAEPVALRPLVDEAAAREDMAGLVNRVDGDCLVMASPDLLRRALANIIRNVRRHAGDGPAEVRAACSGDEVELVVADNGPGVPEALLCRLFDPFFRIDDSRTRETGGTGLGLAIVQTCIQACGGTVRSRNRQPHGLEVVVRLPAAPTAVRGPAR